MKVQENKNSRIEMKKLNLPGEESKKLLEEEKKYISSSYMRPHPIVISHGKGSYVWDVDGNKFLDFSTGIAVCSTGHCHPYVVRSIEEQAEKLLHMSSSDFLYPQILALAKKINEITPGEYTKRCFFSNSGAESIEAGIKLIRWKTKRELLLGFYNSFHGRTYGALSITGSKPVQRKGFGVFSRGNVVHVFYPYCYRCIFNLSHPECKFECIKYIEEIIFKTIAPPEEIGGMVIEPIQGEGGYIVPPENYFNELKKMLNKYDILLLDDEVQSGIGRTGKMFAIEHWGVVPEIICIAKGVASGMPIGITVSKKEIMNWEEGAHASTFGGNPVSCEAALATITLVEKEMRENAEKMGKYLIEKLKEIQKEEEIIGDIRGKGLMVGVELVKDRKTKEYAVEEIDKILYNCLKKGLILLSAGKSVIRFMPPLNVTKEEIEKAIEIFKESIKERKK
jgi:4-aminobutyrate aminotransferase